MLMLDIRASIPHQKVPTDEKAAMLLLLRDKRIDTRSFDSSYQ